MIKPMSNMTPHAFVEIQGALGLNTQELAAKLDLAPGTVSNYKSGRYGIPNEVVRKLEDLLKHEYEKVAELRNQVAGAISITELLTFQNTVRKSREIPNTLGRFMRRAESHPAASKTLPVYRMNARQWGCYVQALGAWHEHVQYLSRHYHDETRQKDYRLELADIKALAASVPRAIPYDVVIQAGEWDVVSRALRHYSKTDPYAFSFYQTWRKNRGAGSYLTYRKSLIEQRIAARENKTK